MRKMRKMTVAVVLAASVTALASGCGKEEIQETSMPESTVSQKMCIRDRAKNSSSFVLK